jgi:hypothetical protein
MSSLRPGDEIMHYHDGSHYWIPPGPDDDQKVWEAAVRAHQEEHRERLGGGGPWRRIARPASVVGQLSRTAAGR